MKMKGEKQMSTLHWTDHAVRPLTHRAAGLFALIADWVRLPAFSVDMGR
jgi:hypothetical protein